MQDKKYWPHDIAEPEPKISLLNEVREFRDREGATILHRWPKQPPLKAVPKDALRMLRCCLVDSKAEFIALRM